MKVDAYLLLQRDIIRGDLAPGEPLIELALAERYKVSRTPVREALHRLLADGLVEQYARGYRVTKHAPEDILAIYEVRVALEQAAARSAALRHTPFDVAKIRRAHQAMVTIKRRGTAELSAATHDFHRAIWAASHNDVLIAMLESIQRRTLAFSSSTLDYPGRTKSALAEHAGILAAIEAGDSELAGQLAADHMTHSRDIRVELYSAGHVDAAFDVGGRGV